MAEKTLYKLSEVVEGNTNWTEVFAEKALIKFFKENKLDLFEWILDNEPERELPDFSGVTTIRELGSILDEYNYSWYELKLEPFTGVKVMHFKEQKIGGRWNVVKQYHNTYMTLDQFQKSFITEKWQGEQRRNYGLNKLGYYPSKMFVSNPYETDTRSVRYFFFYKDGEK